MYDEILRGKPALEIKGRTTCSGADSPDTICPRPLQVSKTLLGDLPFHSRYRVRALFTTPYVQCLLYGSESRGV